MFVRLLSAASALLLGACSVIGVRSGTEEPRFEVSAQQGAVEIRRYAPRLAAETTVAAATEEAARSEGFRRLAGYIFGGNRGQAKIAMTAQSGRPGLRADRHDCAGGAGGGRGGWTIRFFMPAGSRGRPCRSPRMRGSRSSRCQARPWPCCATRRAERGRGRRPARRLAGGVAGWSLAARRRGGGLVLRPALDLAAAAAERGGGTRHAALTRRRRSAIAGSTAIRQAMVTARKLSRKPSIPACAARTRAR